jgi:hypothetical protein
MKRIIHYCPNCEDMFAKLGHLNFTQALRPKVCAPCVSLHAKALRERPVPGVVKAGFPFRRSLGLTFRGRNAPRIGRAG